ncbi:MAG: hypothetical protein KDA63_14635 [Planctomycetales bacterium]|nr:hypothetical protein [Planctomycetales bacterium]
MSSRPHSSVLHRFFAALTEQTFQSQLGVADPQMLDYLSGLLTRFVHTDTIYHVKAPTGRRLDEVAEMLQEGEARTGSPRRNVHRHIGDYTLFWTGLYPEALRSKQSAPRKDFFLDYCSQGKRSYYLASTMGEDEHAEENGILARLSHEFELCAYGLREVRREWERRDGLGDDGESSRPVNPD